MRLFTTQCLFCFFLIPCVLLAQSEDGFYIKSGLGGMHGEVPYLSKASALGFMTEVGFMKKSQGIALRYAHGYKGIRYQETTPIIADEILSSEFSTLETFNNLNGEILNNPALKMKSLSLEYLYYPKNKKGYVGTGLGISQKAPYQFYARGFTDSHWRLLEYTQPIQLSFAGHFGHEIGHIFFEQSIFRGFKPTESFFSVMVGIRLPIQQTKPEQMAFPKDEASFVWDYQRYHLGIGWSMLAYEIDDETHFMQVPQSQLQFGFSNHMTLGIGVKFPMERNEIFDRGHLLNPISRNRFYSAFFLYDFPFGKKEFFSIGYGLENYRRKVNDRTNHGLNAAFHLGLKSGAFQNMLTFHINRKEFGLVELSWSVGLYQVNKSTWRPDLEEEDLTYLGMMCFYYAS